MRVPPRQAESDGPVKRDQRLCFSRKSPAERDGEIAIVTIRVYGGETERVEERAIGESRVYCADRSRPARRAAAIVSGSSRA